MRQILCVSNTYLPQSKEEEHPQTASEDHSRGFPTILKAVGPNYFAVSVTNTVTKINLVRKGLCLFTLPVTVL